jgi:hypothetical protein
MLRVASSGVAAHDTVSMDIAQFSGILGGYIFLRNTAVDTMCCV